jgi:hypothetical protein
MKLYTEDGDFGDRLIVRGPWRASFADFMIENGVKELNLNSWDGFKGKSVAFLRDLPFLEALHVFVEDVEDLDAVLELANLRSFHNAGYDKTPLDFTGLRRLEMLSAHWHPGIQSLFQCSWLDTLSVYDYHGKSFDDFRQFKCMKSVEVVSRTVESLHGIEAMTDLCLLALYYMSKLSSIAGIEQLTHLRRLHMQACKKLGDINFVSTLADLDTLILDNCGDIESLAPIKYLTNLERISFIDTNIKDGDLSVLLQIPKLRSSLFNNKRHYSHRREDLPQIEGSWPK